MNSHLPLSWSRRFFALVVVVLLGGSRLLAQSTATPSLTEGPYYPFNSSQTLSTTWLVGADNDLTLVSGSTTRASGTRFILSGTLVNTSGNAISGATIELWHADNNGIYYHSGNSYANRDSNFQSYGTVTTDSSGAWSFRTVRPGLYTGRIRHFHYKVNINGTTVLTSQFMFSEDSASFSTDNIASSLSSTLLQLTLLTPTSGTDSVDNASALYASKQIIVSYTGTGTVTGTAPSITTQPIPQAIAAGEALSLSVVASGTATLSYQWRKDGTAISGATASTYTVSSATTAQSGAYSVVVTNTAGTATSSAVQVLVTEATARANHALTALSVRSYLSSSSAVLIGGFYVESGGKRLLVRAVGPTLSTYGVSGALADPRLEIYDASGTQTGSNDSWSSDLSTTFSSLGAFSLPSGSKDAALLVTLPAGAGTAHVRGTSAGVALLETYDADSSTANSRLTALSARTLVSSGENVLIAGFAISGSGGKRLMVRAVGPKLADYGVSSSLADPILAIYDSSGVKVAENDSWNSTLSTTFTQLGLFALTSGSKDAALLVTLPAGASYTAMVSSNDSTSGEALVEVYEVP